MNLQPIIDILASLQTYPSFEVAYMPPSDVKTALDASGITLPLNFLDKAYYTATEATYNRLIPYLQTARTRYIPETRDCDWFAFNAFARCQDIFGITALGIALGPTKYGYHAFNFVVLPSLAIKIFEPQRGATPNKLQPLGWNDYQIDKAII